MEISYDPKKHAVTLNLAVALGKQRSHASLGFVVILDDELIGINNECYLMTDELWRHWWTQRSGWQQDKHVWNESRSRGLPTNMWIKRDKKRV